MQQSKLILIGYFPKKIAKREWLKARDITAIRSVSDCISAGPPNSIQHWTHNELGVYSSIAAAIAVVPENLRIEYEMHAYRMLPAKFDYGIETEIELPTLTVEPLPADFQSIGFDAVAEGGKLSFGCSPLSCNSMAEEIKTNEHCLLSTFDQAEQVALRFSIEEPEPGPYYIVEVLWNAKLT